ncbi:MAG: MarC family protein [Candidatus Methanomethylophilus sp.]|nr:MarC family protein [Methanomethylophilus sp.]MDD3232868.1 MarC family protein [Methanomethylophilus sp.]MDD4221590.1 MarC family protein [Methanomethylophilus sp.]
MVLGLDIGLVLTLAASLFFILDPFASLPVFLSVTKGLPPKTVIKYANEAVLVAGILLFVFILTGPTLMDIFGVTMASFRVAGGILLLLMAVEIVFDFKINKSNNEDSAPWVIVATPILTGPGVITQSILLSNTYGIVPVILASAIALLITWVLLRLSNVIVKAVGTQAIGIFSRIIGLLIAAMGVEYIFEGTIDWFELSTALIPLLTVV